MNTDVTGYVWGECTIKVPFPIDTRGVPYISCSRCRYYVDSTRYCRLICDKAAVIHEDKFRANNCPLVLEEDFYE
ncbi:MAG: hypothetical protein IJX77_10210 [Ruminococcus sp.]|nr:hypothetical protein [Ruminococcus sp.]